NYALTVSSPSVLITTPHGTVVRSADALSLVYMPTPDFYGVDNFDYTTENGHGRTAGGAVTVFVNQANNQNPIAADFRKTLPVGALTLSFSVSELLAACSDPDGDAVSLYSIQPSRMGDISVDASSG